MAKTEVKSTQIKQLTVLIDDLSEFGPTDGGSLNLNLKAGRVRDDNTITDASAQVVALTDNTTNFVEITNLGVASANTSAFTAGSIPIAEVVTAGGSISTITDKRSWIATGASEVTNEVSNQTATASQTVFTLPFTYALGSNKLLVFSSGILMRETDDYTETDSTTITFVSGRTSGENITFHNLGSATVNINKFTATASQTVFTLSFSYTLGQSELLVFSGGVLMRITDDYTETNTTTVTFVSGRTSGELITFYKIT